MTEFFLFTTAFLLSYIGVGWFLRWSLRKRIYDIPNERSSHDAPKPRGGGLVFVVVSLTFYCFYTIIYRGGIEIGFLGYVAGAILISIVSWLDDLFSISFVWRFLIHALAAFLVIYNLGYTDELFLPAGNHIEIGKTGVFFTFCWIVWLTNAYNFMDGIDGIAGMQAVTAGLGWFLT